VRSLDGEPIPKAIVDVWQPDGEGVYEAQKPGLEGAYLRGVYRTDKDGRYVVVDYVNDPCDMRLQSKHFDGVPDAIVQMIISCITDHLKKQLSADPGTSGEDARWWP